MYMYMYMYIAYTSYQVRVDCVLYLHDIVHYQET